MALCSGSGAPITVTMVDGLTSTSQPQASAAPSAVSIAPSSTAQFAYQYSDVAVGQRDAAARVARRPSVTMPGASTASRHVLLDDRAVRQRDHPGLAGLRLIGAERPLAGARAQRSGATRMRPRTAASSTRSSAAVSPSSPISSLTMSSQRSHRELVGHVGPQRAPLVDGRGHRVDAEQRHAADDEGIDGRRQVVASGQAAGRHRAAVADRAQRLGQRRCRRRSRRRRPTAGARASGRRPR